LIHKSTWAETEPYKVVGPNPPTPLNWINPEPQHSQTAFRKQGFGTT